MTECVTTPQGYDLFEVLSALQKTIRRGLDREAFFWASELARCEPPTVLRNRLEIVVNEDIGPANPRLIPFVHGIRQQLEEDPAGRWEAWEPVLRATLYSMCRSPKSREADHFQWVIRNRRRLEGLRLEPSKPACNRGRLARSLGIDAKPRFTQGRYESLQALADLREATLAGAERDAMFWAVELGESVFWDLLWRWLERIAVEDMADPAEALVLIRALSEQATSFKVRRKDAWYLMLANAILALARGDHSDVRSEESLDPDARPDIPDYALDQHTRRGRQLGRGLEHFRREGARLDPISRIPDAYEEEAYALWGLAGRDACPSSSATIQCPGEASPAR